jgi:single-strand DNA-binding protein
MNLVILSGRLTRDPELKHTKNNKMFAQFSVAVQRFTQGQKTADFIDCQAWGKTAELIGQYLGKGSQCMIEGRLQIDRVQGDSGTKYFTKVVVGHVEFIGPRPAEKEKAGEAGQQELTGVPAELKDMFDGEPVQPEYNPNSIPF